MIGVAAAAKTSNEIESLPVVGGIIACGIFLLFIAIVGLVGAIKHHQVMLFFYMVSDFGQCLKIEEFFRSYSEVSNKRIVLNKRIG